MIGCDPQFPSGFEQGRMRDALVEATAPSPHRSAKAWMPWAGALLAGAAAIALLIPRAELPSTIATTQSPASDLRTRGSEVEDASFGLGLSGVPREQPTAEYEVVSSAGVHLNDFLRLYTTRMSDAEGYLFTLITQQGRPPIWFAPMPPEETQSVSVTKGRSVMLEAEYAVDAERYAPGAAMAIAIYSATPLSLTTVEPLMAALDSTRSRDELAASVAKRLGLGSAKQVVTVPFKVLPPRPQGSNAP